MQIKILFFSSINYFCIFPYLKWDFLVFFVNFKRHRFTDHLQKIFFFLVSGVNGKGGLLCMEVRWLWGYEGCDVLLECI